MNPTIILPLVLILCLVVWIGRKGPQKVEIFVRRYRSKIIGIFLLILAALIALRGLWLQSIIAFFISWWLLNNGNMPGPIGRALKIYLDRWFPGWRQYVDPNANASIGTNNSLTIRGVMTEQEAYQVLGLQFGESREAIGAAYRAAMKKVHPDQGGATELAVRLNQARDLLLSRQHGFSDDTHF